MYRAVTTGDPSPEPLPSVAQIANAGAMSVSARAGELRALFTEIGDTAAKDVLRELGFAGDAVFGLAVSAAIGVVTGVARYIPGTTSSTLLGVSFVVGLLYGIGRVVTWKIRWVDKTTKQEVTVVIPLIVGFGYGLLAFFVERALSYLPVIPSAVAASILAAGLFALWSSKYRRRHAGLDRIPCVGFGRELFAAADPTALGSASWSSEPKTFQASAMRRDGIQIDCLWRETGRSTSFEMTARFPAVFQWRHPTDNVVLDGIALERLPSEQGPVVRAINANVPATAKLLLQAMSIVTSSCASGAQ